MLRVIWFVLLVAFACLQADVSIVRHSSQEILLRLNIQHLDVEPVATTPSGPLYTLYYEGAELLKKAGAPQLPYTRVRVIIPPGAQVKASASATTRKLLEGKTILPAMVYPNLDHDPQLYFDPSIYEANLPYPDVDVRVSEPHVFRHFRVVDVDIFPVHYLAGARQILFAQQVTVRLQLENGRPGSGAVRLAPGSQELLGDLFINFKQAAGWALPTGKALFKTVDYDFSVGQWYRIPVEKEGVYRITGAFLRDAGIDISRIQPETIQMFNYGGAPLPISVNRPRPEDLNEIDIQVVDQNGNGQFEDGDYVLFYGRGVDGWTYNPNAFPTWQGYHHPYDLRNYYLLTFNQKAGRRMQVVNSLNASDVERPSAFNEHVRFEEDHINSLASGPDWYWVRLQGTFDQARLAFTLPQHMSAGQMLFKIRFKGESESRFADPNQPRYRDTLTVFVNDEPLINNLVVATNNTKAPTFTFADLRAVQPGLNEMLIVQRGNMDGARVLMDFFEFHFLRPFIAEDEVLKFNHKYANRPAEFSLTGFSIAETRVWDVTRFDRVREIVPLERGTTLRFQDSGNPGEMKTYLAFSTSRIEDVASIEPIPNRPNLRDPDRKGRLLILLPDEFYDVAEELETWHETHQPDPIETERVRLSDIYREFSSTVQDPVAIRDFVRYAYYNWSVPPQYVLLLGDGSYDYRNLVLKNYKNRVPPFEIEGPDEIDSRESDNFYVAINHESDELRSIYPELAIGRVPANSVADVESYIDKVKTYDQAFLRYPNWNGWQNVITLVADDQFSGPGVTNEWIHLKSTERLVAVLPEKFDLSKIYLHDFEKQAGGLGRIKPKATEVLLNQINRGSLIINFFGHGNPTTWAHEWVLQRSRDLPRIENQGRLPLWLAATCNWGRYDDPNINSMAETMVIIPDRGGIGVVAASRAVYASGNEAFVLKLAQHSLKNKGRSTVLGDAMLASLGGNSNDQKFHLFGDPSLRLADPEHEIEILSITPDTLKALATVTVEAAVKDENGNVMTDFDGEALIRVFDAQDTLKAGGQRYVYQGPAIFKGFVNVKGGYLTASFIVPRSIKYKKYPTGRISIYAWSENHRDALGYRNDLLLYGSEKGIADQEGPEIDFSFQENPDFMDGDFVPRQPTLVVHLSDPSGINLTREVGHHIELLIDGALRKDVTEFFVYDRNSFQSGELRYTLPPLNTGEHTVKITAWDNLNNFSEQEIHFRTSASQQILLEEVMNYPNPFSENTFFTFQFDSPGGVADVKIRIYTVRGRLIQELEGTARPGFNKIFWDGRDRDGDLVANGVYLYKIIVDDGQKRLEKIEKLAVIR